MAAKMALFVRLIIFDKISWPSLTTKEKIGKRYLGVNE